MHHDVAHLIHAYGLIAVFIIVGLESVGIPLPGELSVIIAATVASTHDAALWPIILAASAGAILGDNIGYLLGKEFGQRLVLRYGWRLGITEEHLKLSRYLFNKYGAIVVFVGRFVAVLRVLAAFLAGASALPWRKFLIANALGGILWATLVASGAYWLGRSFSHLHGPLSYGLLVFGIVVVGAGMMYFKRNEQRLIREAMAADPDPIPGFVTGR